MTPLIIFNTMLARKIIFPYFLNIKTTRCTSLSYTYKYQTAEARAEMKSVLSVTFWKSKIYRHWIFHIRIALDMNNKI
jgi:hypothetical protein